ncbi:AraC family transcriptional regulator [Paraburkholderia sediminicola]|uniref:helix-turn-helix transcriptional regulator n=1 Tax=Paraburkholderia sediminicola TaxID=458836 RepID=UPI0038BB8C53
MGKIAVTLQQALAQRAREGTRGSATARPLAQGGGWDVADVLCTFGPRDQPFEERHAGVCIAMVVAGAFGYRAGTGRELLTPGALLLGNPDDCFECGHRHAAGDRCIAFRYAPAYFERLAADAGIASGNLKFRRARVPSLPALSPLIARACAGASDTGDAVWDELAVELAVSTLRAAGALTRAESPASPAAWSRVAQTVRLIDETPGAPHTLTSLAVAAGLSEFYFLRTFQRVTGVTPHQYVLRARLRAAALRLQDDSAKVVDIALDCGFNDLSNFNHAFRAEFASSPRAWRARGRARGA